MGNMEGRLGNGTPTTSWHRLHWWKSPRWIVIRIEALAVVAIIISFFLAAFGSCRRWSNSWIVQKGFFAAQVLSLSLGTYSIGLMQSSSVKSEMYPIWTVSLFACFGCIDPVIAYNGLDYKGPLSKMVYGICLQFGYVLLMSISTISGGVGNTAIIMLSGITFIKCFHRSLALTQQSRMRNMVQGLPDDEEEKVRGGEKERGEVGEEEEKEVKIGYFCRPPNQIPNKKLSREQCTLIIDFHSGTSWTRDDVNILDICDVLEQNNDELWPCYDACVSFGLSHKLQRHFLGLDRRRRPKTNSLIIGTDFNWALKVIEIELAFLYEMFFTGNAFLHYYQAKAASLWALASFVGICFVWVAAAVPGTVSRPPTTCRPGGCTYVVDTTTADLVITFVILVSLAMLQLMHLIRCWTSNWARVAVACAYARGGKIERNFSRHMFWTMMDYLFGGLFPCFSGGDNLPKRRKKKPASIHWWMRMKSFVATSTNWFDKYLWQDKIGQYSLLPEVISLTDGKQEQEDEWCRPKLALLVISAVLFIPCARLVKVLGLDYVWVVLRDLLGSDTNKSAAVTLESDVKASIIGFLGQIETERIDDNWLCFPNDHPIIKRLLPYYDDPVVKAEAHGYRYTSCVMAWHIATWYCELVELEREKQQHALSKAKEHRIYIGCFPSLKKNAAGQRRVALEENRNRRVANALSKYCAYLVVSAPELLPAPTPETNRAYSAFSESVRASLFFLEDLKRLLGAMSDPEIWTHLVSAAKENWERHLKLIVEYKEKNDYHYEFMLVLSSVEVQMKADPLFWDAVGLAKLLLGDDPPLLGTTRRSDELWETLARVWVRLLVYAAPYGNAEAHMRHLAQGGDFITHLWALLYHFNIREWKHPETNLHSITTMDDAERILAEDDMAVVAFLSSLSAYYSNELATASKLEDGVRFYQTSSPDVAKHFHMDPEAGDPSLVLLNIEAKEKFTLYDGSFRAYDIAYFVTSNKLAFAKTRAQRTAPSSVDNPIKKQSSEDGQTEDEIAKESSGDGSHGQTKDEIVEEEISPLS